MPEREILDLDVLFVGAGPASLAGAIQLKRLFNESGCEASVAVLEKASEVGAHSLSGAIFDPISLIELFPDYKDRNVPFLIPLEISLAFSMSSRILITT